MLADAAACNHRILQGHAAEGKHDLAMRGQLLPGDIVHRQAVIIPQHMRNNDGGSAGAVAIDRADEAAHRKIKEAMYLALRVVKTPCTGPTIGSTENCSGSMAVLYSQQFSG